MDKMVKYSMVQNVTTKGPRYFKITGTGPDARNSTFFPKRALRISTTMSPSPSPSSSNFSTLALNGSDGSSYYVMGKNPNAVAYFIVPLILLVALIGVSMMIWSLIKKRKKWDDLRHTLIPRDQSDIDSESSGSISTSSQLAQDEDEPVELTDE